MISNDEEESLLRDKRNFYGENNNENGDQRWRSRTPSLADAFDDKLNINRKSSRLEWARSSWTRWLYVLFWWWLNPLLDMGYKQTLTDNDLDDIPHQDKSSVLLRKLLIYDWSRTTTWRIVLHAFGKQTVYIGLINLPLIGARLAQPLFIRAIVGHVYDSGSASHEMTLGILLAIGLFVSSMLQAFLYQHLIYNATQLGVRIRNALSATIYRHLLSINMSSLQQTTAAQTINLVANDATQFENLWIYGQFLWAAPVEALIAFGILSLFIGVLPTSFAFIILLLLIPLQVKFSRYFSACHQRTMLCTDRRIKAYGELLDGCQIVKMYNWEKPMEKRIHQMREEELSSIKFASRLWAFNTTLFFVLPCLISLVVFGGMWILGYQLRPIDVFTALAFFGHIRLPLVNLMPMAIERLSAMFVASRRIDTFMRLKTTLSQKRQSRTLSDKDKNKKSGTIVMNNASFSWGDINNTCLSSLHLDIKSGQFVGIVGSVGAGKSSLLGAILGEMNLTNGSIEVNGSLSYAAQSTWLFADTLRANILLGKKLNQERYTRVLRACCLDVDLAAFGEAGDLIMVGEKGVNLSGGQKARVSLARALYVDADIYLLDDPLSAVDTKVAKRLFDDCIGPQGILKGKTRLLVTHQTHFLSSSDQCLMITNGSIEEYGSFDQLSIGHEHINIISTDNKIEKQTDNTQEITAEELDLSKSVTDTKSILRDETSIIGHVRWSVWARLFTAPPLGWFGLVSLIIALLAGEIFYDVTIYWLAVWSRKPFGVQQGVYSFAYIYLVLTLITITAALTRANYWFYIILRGSANLHNSMLKSILYTSMRFFESNSVGRILNRASREQYLVDALLPMTMFDAVQALMIVAGSMVIIVLVNPLVFPLVIAVSPVCWYLRRYYSRTNRQLKRLESVTRSPIYTLFSSSLSGLTTIRGFKMKDDFIETFLNRVDANTRTYIPLLSGIHWFGLRLDFIAATFILLSAVLSIIMSDTIDPSLTALSLTCSLNLIGRFQWGMRQLSEAENLMTSAERIDEYAQLPSEEDNGGNKGLIQTSADWPNRGSIEFRDYTLRYRSELEPVLRNVNLLINPTEKIGVIGRTGAGKSSLFQALFRLIERSSVDGQILIDNIDISRLTLDHLRSHLSIIPQMPILFSGTLRYNLDPFEIYTDDQCLTALESVQLKRRICDHPDGLYMSIAESGSNFSVGECQLICVARAILKQTKILLIDEATANVDQQTDALIQAVIIDKFRDRTILTIAHRLNTIAESDRILVMEKGRVANFDVPKNIIPQL